jgi:1-acyl-sn-glycerol-3-phosphate acyltransferase
MLLPIWFLYRPGSRAARAIQRRFHHRVLSGFGVEIEVRGIPSPEPGTLFVSNHISWADIAVLGAVIDAHFVAKSDIASWPLLGGGARRTGTLFVERERRHGVSGQADAIRERLSAGDSMILFPEGTTSDGREILPFRTSLFASADAAQRVQPVALIYAAPDGKALTPERLAEIAWTDDEALLPNAMALVSAPSRVILCFLPPVDPRDFPDRKTLASFVREELVRHYASAVA